MNEQEQYLANSILEQCMGIAGKVNVDRSVQEVKEIISSGDEAKMKLAAISLSYLQIALEAALDAKFHDVMGELDPDAPDPHDYDTQIALALEWARSARQFETMRGVMHNRYAHVLRIAVISPAHMGDLDADIPPGVRAPDLWYAHYPMLSASHTMNDPDQPSFEVRMDNIRYIADKARRLNVDGVVILPGPYDSYTLAIRGDVWHPHIIREVRRIESGSIALQESA